MRGPRRMRRLRLRYSPLSRSDAFALEVPFAATIGDVGEPPSRVSPQNIENNPMQSNEATAGAWTSNLTRRANQRYLLLFRNHANAPVSPQQRTRPSRLRSENSYPLCHCKGDLAGKHSIRINDQWRGRCSGGSTRVRRTRRQSTVTSQGVYS